MFWNHPLRGRRRRMRRRAGIVAASALLAGAMAAPGVAHAGTYKMFNCNAPGHVTGNRGPWVLEPNAGGSTGLTLFDSCGGGGSFGFTGTVMRPGTVGSVKLVRPAGISVTALRTWFAGRAAGSGSPAYTLLYNDGAKFAEWGAPGIDFSAGAGYASPVVPANSWQMWAFCGNVAGQNCNLANTVPLSVSGVEATLSEATAPGASFGGGTLTTAGAKKGVKTLTVTGTDAHSGVQRLEALLDDTIVGTVDYDRDWTRPLSSQKAGTCAFDTWSACPASQTTSFSVDTARLPDSAYTLSVRATDAAGNVKTTTAAAPVTIDNTAPAAPAATSPVSVRTTAASTQLTWAHPNGQVAPIVAAHVSVTGPTGKTEDIVVPVSGASGAATLNRIHGFGAYTVRVALEDAAGNVDPARAQTYYVTFAEPATPVPTPTPTPPVITPVPTGGVGPAGPSGPAGPAGVAGAAGAGGAGVVLHLNGANAGPGASLRAAFVGSRSRTLRSAYGRKVTIAGQLVDAGGRPITGARISVLVQDKMVGARMIPAGEVVTDASGRFRYLTTALRSRTIRFGYRLRLEDVAFARTTDVSLSVVARISLRPSRRSLRNGEVVVFRGTVAGAPRNARKVVELQVRKGSSWMTFRSTRLRNGRFSERYRFRRTRGRVTYVFRARVRQEAGFPFLTGVSRPARVTVRG